MTRWPALARRLAACLVLVAAAARAPAAEVRVLSAGAFNGVAAAMAPGFQSATGTIVTLRSDTVGGLVRRIEGGEAFDVVLMSPAGLGELAKAGKIAPGAVTVLARVGIGAGVRAGAPRPDIGTVEAFKAALLNARAVAYVDPASGGTSGIYLTKLFQRLGVADAVAAKAVPVRGGLAAEALLDGRADLALQQASEIVAVPGVTLVGPLPAAIQAETTYAGAVAARPAEPGAARGFLAAMAGDAARPVLAAKGMTPP